MSCDVGEMTESLENELCYEYNYELCSFSNLSITSPTSQLILQPFRRFTYITAHSPTLLLLHLRHSSFSSPSFAPLTSQAHSPTFPSLHLCHNSFSNPSVALPILQLILQPFRWFTYITAHSPTLPLLHLRHRSFSNPSFLSSTSQAHSPTFPSLHLRHNSFSNPSVALPKSQLIFQPFRCFTYVTVHSPTLLSLLLHHKLFT